MPRNAQAPIASTQAAQRKLAELGALARSLAETPSVSDAHERVLRAAMQLMAERGYAGASLRALAERLCISQPSLYHYFASKEDLVEQVVRAQAARILCVPDDLPEQATLAEGLRYGLQRLIDTYRSPDHVVFVRFLLAVGSERPELRTLAREILLERGLLVLETFVSGFVAGDALRAEDVRPLCEMLVMAMAMKLFSHHALFGPPPSGSDFETYADFVVDTALHGVEARSTRAHEKDDRHG